MKHLLIILLLLCSVSVSAQDIIVKKDGSRVPCRVVNVTTTEISYRFNGTNYVMDRSLASEIDYENGKVEVFDKTENMYKPHNQNDGVQQYNDNLLISLDKKAHTRRKSPKIRTLAWVGGGILAGIGVGLIGEGANIDEHKTTLKKEPYFVGGGVCLAGSCVWTIMFLKLTNKIKRREDALLSSEIWHEQINLKNGSSISAGMDLLNDRTMGNNTIGLGLRYNF